MRRAEIIGDPAEWARWLTAATLIGLVLGVIGPFGSYGNDEVIARMAYWTGVLWLGTIVMRLSVGSAIAYAPSVGVSPNIAAAGATILACIPLAIVVAFINRGLWPQYTNSLRPLEWYAQTLFVAGALVAGSLWFEQMRRTRPPSAAPAPTAEALASAGARVSQLPNALVAQALCLQMEDHYVRVHTASGSELVLLPMHRAIVDLHAVEGLRVHRSWWVARNAVREIKRDGRSTTLILSNGSQVPVARNQIASLRAAGWLDQFGAA